MIRLKLLISVSTSMVKFIILKTNFIEFKLEIK